MRRRGGHGGGQEANDGAAPPSESERLLFGGSLRYDVGWSQHEQAFIELTAWSMVTRLPRLLGSGFRLALQADRRAVHALVGSEFGRGAAQALSLLAINRVLAGLVAGTTIQSRLRGVMPALIVVTAAMTISALLRAVSTYATGRLEPKVERVATEAYLERASRVELAAIEDDEFHRLLDSARFGASSARRMMDSINRIVNAMISFVTAAGVLTVLHPVLLPLLVAMTVPSAWRALVTARRRYQSFHTWTQHSRAGALLSQMLTNVGAAPEVRVHGVGPFLLHHFRALSEAAEAEQARLARIEARTGLIAASGIGVATVATYLTLGGLLLGGAMALSVAGTAVIAIRTGSGSLNSLVLEINGLHQEALFVGDLERLCAEADRRAIPTGGKSLPQQPASIRFDRVTFRYPGSDGPPALDDVSLTIPTGRIIALVGGNGSGKTTLAKLLAGLYTPQRGRILWDDVDATEADRQQLSDRIAMVAQDFTRWSFTARANFAIGRPEIPISDARLRAAVRQAGAQELVAELPRGLDTLLARGFRGGHQLSGGQWQRIGIGRASYRQSQILIVDEPTAALDARAEIKAFDEIRALADGGRTVLLITHRLASVRHADLVHVLDRGRIVESGAPDELLAAGGLYAELYELQASQFAVGPPRQSLL